MTVTWPKIEIFKIQDGGGHHLENSSTDCPISAKFSMRKENGMSTRVTWQKLQIFLIQDHGRPPFWKSLNRHISVKNRPILMKFGTLHQILNPVTDTWPKIEILKIQDGGVRYLENCFYGHKSSTDCPISAKFCMRKQNGRSTRETWQKLHIFKIQDGGRPLFWKSLNCHTSVEKSSHFDEIWYTASDIEPGYSHVTTKCNFWNWRWQFPPSWKSFFWPLLINRLSDFSEILYEKAEWHADKGYRTRNANV